MQTMEYQYTTSKTFIQSYNDKNKLKNNEIQRNIYLNYLHPIKKITRRKQERKKLCKPYSLISVESFSITILRTRQKKHCTCNFIYQYF